MRVIVIVGPTASGKTRLGVEVAHRLGSEIVSADSRQVYRGLDIGTGKDLDEYSQVTPPVPYHLIDIAEPDEVYTLFRFQKDCYSVFRSFSEREGFATGAIPLVMVGGTGLYVESVVRDYRIVDVPQNASLRQRLDRLATDELVLMARREMADPEVIDFASRRRLIRELEIAEARRQGPVESSSGPGLEISYSVFGFAIERQTLQARIRRRLVARLDEGLIDEVRTLLDSGLEPKRLHDLGLEYREVAAYLLGKKSRDRMQADLERAIGRFAKRQQTWFRGMEKRGIAIEWIDPDDVETVLAESV